jgi:hypothetical protein
MWSNRGTAARGALADDDGVGLVVAVFADDAVDLDFVVGVEAAPPPLPPLHPASTRPRTDANAKSRMPSMLPLARTAKPVRRE